jgi:hypothetical protein
MHDALCTYVTAMLPVIDKGELMCSIGGMHAREPSEPIRRGPGAQIYGPK